MTEAKPAAGSEPQPEPEAPKAVLFYAGDGEQYIHGVPATDLSEADIARLVYIETMTPGGAGVSPDDAGFAKAREKVVDRLAASPLYRKTAPKE